jgi:UDP-N-acetylmuramyl pentapeptide phosphotransferase/UDP-N-acetylglucosamine-1-phosphate transferase
MRRLVTAAVAAVVARQTYRSMQKGASAKRWERTNHRGEVVTLAEGPSVAVGTLAGLMVTPCPHAAVRSGAMVGVVGASLLGAVDDLTGAADIKGLKGHLSALRTGQVTTGSLKLFGLAATGLVAGTLARRGRGGIVDAVLAGGVVAGAANLVNLFDLRPGRAAKIVLASSSPPLLIGSSALTFGDLVAPPVGAVSALLAEDLAEHSMLGDTGANALGAAWGAGAAATMSRAGLAGTLVAIGALTVLSERISFSQVIEQTRALHYLDGLGRRRS